VFWCPVVKVETLSSIGVVYLTLRAARLGEDRPYRVCWRLKSKQRACALVAMMATS
jgi:hypothetical protein